MILNFKRGGQRIKLALHEVARKSFPAKTTTSNNHHDDNGVAFHSAIMVKKVSNIEVIISSYPSRQDLSFDMFIVW